MPGLNWWNGCEPHLRNAYAQLTDGSKGRSRLPVSLQVAVEDDGAAPASAAGKFRPRRENGAGRGPVPPVKSTN